jgi:hypothetical protein
MKQFFSGKKNEILFLEKKSGILILILSDPTKLFKQKMVSIVSGNAKNDRSAHVITDFLLKNLSYVTPTFITGRYVYPWYFSLFSLQLLQRYFHWMNLTVINFLYT